MLSLKRLATTYMMPCQNYSLQLWVRTKLDESPYPLIGHEIPLVIKVTAILRYCICLHHTLFFIKIVTNHIYRLLPYLAFLQLHWMRQTFNNKNQKTYDEYRQGCRWFIVLDYSKSNHIFVWQNRTIFETFFASRCSFILRRVGQVSSFSGGEGAGSQKKKLKKVKNISKSLSWKKSILTRSYAGEE